MPYLYAASSLPRCTLTMCCSEYLACQRSLGLLVRSTPAPPILKRVLGMSMERSLPEYQLSVMFSVETTRALLLGSPASSLWARPTAITPAEHPIPVTCDVQHAQYLNVVMCVKRCAQYLAVVMCVTQCAQCMKIVTCSHSQSWMPQARWDKRRT